MATSPMATLVQKAMCRTTAAHRPHPSILFFPGLTSRPFWDASELPLGGLVDSLDVIKEEYGVMKAAQGSDYHTTEGEHVLNEGSWDWHSLVQKGRVQTEFAVKCPKTTEAITNLPRLMLGVPFAYAFFSTLHAGSRIKPHFGPSNLRLRVHLPLSVPSGCGIRVAGEDREWAEGEPLVFDDAYEHEVWNDSDEDRVLLLLDLWHPELTAGEIVAVQGMFDQARDKGWLT